jgi:anti-sigma B factor antagonist
VEFQGDMKLEIRGDTLAIGELVELGANNCQLFRDQVYAALPESLRNIEVDLSSMRYLDSCGLGALISLQKTATRRNGTMRVLNPSPRVQLLFDVTRMQRVFEVIRS